MISVLKATIKMTDYLDNKELDVILLLDTLSSENPSITYVHIRTYINKWSWITGEKKEIRKKIKNNEFFNALQIKFAYAITCHKSQGGQWENVFIDLGYFTENILDKSYIRWLYTAFTRATKKLFLINFNDKFFK